MILILRSLSINHHNRKALGNPSNGIAVAKLFIMKLLIDGSSGQYVPQAFAKAYAHYAITEEMKNKFAELELGPDKAPDYWEIWDEVLMELRIVIDGKEYVLYQDGDLFLRGVDKEKVYELKIEGGGTREEMAKALRLIATALDGRGKYPQQPDENIEGGEWNDCTLRTHLSVFRTSKG